MPVPRAGQAGRRIVDPAEHVDVAAIPGQGLETRGHLIIGAVLAIFLPIFRFMLGAEIFIYLIALVAVGVLSAIRQKKAHLLIGLPLAIVTMHFTWGAGFLWSMIKEIFNNRDPERN